MIRRWAIETNAIHRDELYHSNLRATTTKPAFCDLSAEALNCCVAERALFERLQVFSGAALG